MVGRFDWNVRKDAENQRKHGVGFALAREAFLDPARVIARDLAHSSAEGGRRINEEANSILG